MTADAQFSLGFVQGAWCATRSGGHVPEPGRGPAVVAGNRPEPGGWFLRWVCAAFA